MTHLLHGSNNVVFRDDSTVVRVELLKKRLHHVVVQELLHVQGCYQELRVVDFLVSEIVHFIYYFVYFSVGNINVALLHGSFEFLYVDESCSVKIKLLEFFSEFVYFSGVSHLNEHVHGSLLQFALALERNQIFQDLFVDFEVFIGYIIHLEPLVTETL